MLKYCLKKWHENRDKLEAAIRKDAKLNDCDYTYLLKLLVEHVLNGGDCGVCNEYKLQANYITKIDDGDYQGTFLFLIPEATYQPSAHEYLMTYIYYGSCSGCDTLQHIQSLWYNDEPVPEEAIKEFMMLCKDFIMNMIKPYNYGWCHEDEYDPVTMDEEDD